MAKLAHGMPIPSNIKLFDVEEEEAIILEYTSAFEAANGYSPELSQCDDGNWKIGSMKNSDAVFFVFEFPLMTKTLWERAWTLGQPKLISTITSLGTTSKKTS